MQSITTLQRGIDEVAHCLRLASMSFSFLRISASLPLRATFMAFSLRARSRSSFSLRMSCRLSFSSLFITLVIFARSSSCFSAMMRSCAPISASTVAIFCSRRASCSCHCAWSRPRSCPCPSRNYDSLALSRTTSAWNSISFFLRYSFSRCSWSWSAWMPSRTSFTPASASSSCRSFPISVCRCFRRVFISLSWLSLNWRSLTSVCFFSSLSMTWFSTATFSTMSSQRVSLCCFCCMWKALTLPSSCFRFSSRCASTFLLNRSWMAASSFQSSLSREPSRSLISLSQLAFSCLTSPRWLSRQSLLRTMNSSASRLRRPYSSRTSASFPHRSCIFSASKLASNFSICLRCCSSALSAIAAFSCSARCAISLRMARRLLSNCSFISRVQSLRRVSQFCWILAISRLLLPTMRLISGSRPFSVFSAISSSFRASQRSRRSASARAQTSRCALQSSSKLSLSFLSARSRPFRRRSISSVRVMSSSFSLVSFSTWSSWRWQRSSSILLRSARSPSSRVRSCSAISSCELTSRALVFLSEASVSSCRASSSCRPSRLPLASMMASRVSSSALMSSRQRRCLRSISLANFSRSSSCSGSMRGCSCINFSMLRRFSEMKLSSLPCFPFSSRYFAARFYNPPFMIQTPRYNNSPSSNQHDNSCALLQLREGDRAQVGVVLRAGGRAGRERRPQGGGGCGEGA